MKKKGNSNIMNVDIVRICSFHKREMSTYFPGDEVIVSFTD